MKTNPLKIGFGQNFGTKQGRDYSPLKLCRLLIIKVRIHTDLNDQAPI